MSDIEQHRLPSEHTPDDIWNAINTPLLGHIGGLVNPYVLVECKDLSDKGTIQLGTLVTYRPNANELETTSLGMIASALPKDIDLRVEEFDPEKKIRVDVLESKKHSGLVRHSVEEVDGTGLLVVEGDLALGGSLKLFESTVVGYAGQGLAEHNQRILDNLPTILGR